MVDKKYLLLACDLYWLRFKKPGEQWYELTDYIRDKLREDGYIIEYTKDDIIFNGINVKKLCKPSTQEKQS